MDNLNKSNDLPKKYANRWHPAAHTWAATRSRNSQTTLSNLNHLYYSHQLVEVSQLFVGDTLTAYEEKRGKPVFTDSDVLPCKAAYLLVRDAYVETLQTINSYEAQQTGTTKFADGSY